MSVCATLGDKFSARVTDSRRKIKWFRRRCEWISFVKSECGICFEWALSLGVVAF